MGKETEGRLGQMGQLVGKKGLIERKKRKRSKRKEEKRKKKRQQGVEGKQKKKRGMHVQDGSLSPPQPPSVLTAPKVRPLKIETAMIAHT